MNFKLTLSLAIILLIAAFIYMFAARNQTAATQASGTTSLLVKKPDGLKSITYLHDATVQVKFDKQGDDWVMTEPQKCKVDPANLDNIASTLINLNYVRKFEPEATGDRTPEATGTAKPHNTVKFTDTAGVDYSLALGYRANDGTFATFNGGKTIYVLESSPLSQLDKDDLNDFRNKTIKQVDVSKITKLELKTEKDKVTFSRIDGKWQITAPVSARANATAASDLVNLFQNIQAIKFSPLNKQLAGVDPGIATVTAWVEESPASTSPATAPSTASAPATAESKFTQVTLQLGYAADLANRDSSPVYASLAGSDEVFTLGRAVFTKMNKELKDLRDNVVIPVPTRQATSVSVTVNGSPTLSASGKGQEWTLTPASSAPDAKPLPGDAFAISEFLGVIADLRAIKFVDVPGDLKSLGLDPPHMKIDLTIPGQTQHEVLLVGNSEEALEGGKMTPVMRQGEPTVYLVQTSDGDRLSTSPVKLRDRQIDRLDANSIRKIEISGPRATVGIPAPSTAPASQPATASAPAVASAPATAPANPLLLAPGVTLEREGTGWLIKKAGESRDPDDSKITSLLAEFTPLRAVKYVSDKAPPEGTPDIVVTLTILQPAFVPPAATVPATGAATAPATAPATQTAATATAPATAPATRPTLAELLPVNGTMGPDAGKLVTRTLRLYRRQAPATTSAPAATQPAETWEAVWDEQTPAWTFEPEESLVQQVSKEFFTVTPATQPATTSQPAVIH
jgi:hypothetical protein